MPIYEYRCRKGHTFEVMQRIADDPVSTCEVCGQPVQRVLHPVAVHFKGSGFYNTDYGTRKRARELKEARDGSGSSGGDSAKGGDSVKDSAKKGPDSGSSSSSSGSGGGEGASPAKPAAKASSGD